FYLTRDVPIVEGHALYVDSPWALTSISEVQFWKEHFDISKSDDGKARGLISVCVSEWAAEGIDGAPPAEDSPSRAALVAQVWDQLKAALNHDGEEVLKDEDLHAWYLDEDVNFLPEARQVNRGREPLFINRTGDWRRRPDAATKIPNLFLASDYVRTYTDVACMEAANEAARRAVNAILTATGSKAEPCELWPLTEPAFFAPFKKADQIRFDRGLPWIGKDEPELPLYPPPTAKYVDRVPNIVHRQPFICRDVQMFGYFLEGDQAAMQKMIDRYLNEPAGGAVDYRVLADLVLCTFADARYCTSTLPPGSDEGTVREVSFTMWVPTAAYEGGEPVRLAQFVPFIMVDNCWSMAAGREIYGFPKEMASFVFPDDPKTAERFQATTLVIKKFSPTSRGEHLPLIELRKEHGGGVLDRLRRFVDRAEAGLSLLHDVWGDGIGRDFIKDLLSNALDKEVPAVFLKQFRDVADGRLAAYQGVIEAGVIASKIRDAGFLDGRWSCHIHEYESHPLREELGLPKGDKLDALLPFHVHLDFLAREGREVWRAGPAAEAPPKKKIAVLGGGVGGMTAAYELTEEPGWSDKYEITVYQMGWRIGGKGASGRNMDDHARIEEHGLHLWFGYYHNAFNLMRKAYEANGRPAGAPLATVEEAFKAHGEVDIAEHDGTDWNVWRIGLPIVPGEFPGGEEPSFAHLLANMVKA
ncbi:MAG: NAD(P)-binding protein, partial [Pseudomonadota bacterium]